MRVWPTRLHTDQAHYAVWYKTSFMMPLVNNWSIRTQMQKQSSAIAKWENITQVLQPFSHEPSLDPKTLYLVPRPETQELDSVISRVETQLTELEVQRVTMYFVAVKGGCH